MRRECILMSVCVPFDLTSLELANSHQWDPV